MPKRCRSHCRSLRFFKKAADQKAVSKTIPELHAANRVLIEAGKKIIAELYQPEWPVDDISSDAIEAALKGALPWRVLVMGSMGSMAGIFLFVPIEKYVIPFLVKHFSSLDDSDARKQLFYLLAFTAMLATGAVFTGLSYHKNFMSNSFFPQNELNCLRKQYLANCVEIETLQKNASHARPLLSQKRIIVS